MGRRPVNGDPLHRRPTVQVAVWRPMHHHQLGIEGVQGCGLEPVMDDRLVVQPPEVERSPARVIRQQSRFGHGHAVGTWNMAQVLRNGGDTVVNGRGGGGYRPAVPMNPEAGEHHRAGDTYGCYHAGIDAGVIALHGLPEVAEAQGDEHQQRILEPFDVIRLVGEKRPRQGEPGDRDGMEEDRAAALPKRKGVESDDGSCPSGQEAQSLADTIRVQLASALLVKGVGERIAEVRPVENEVRGAHGHEEDCDRPPQLPASRGLEIEGEREGGQPKKKDALRPDETGDQPCYCKPPQRCRPGSIPRLNSKRPGDSDAACEHWRRVAALRVEHPGAERNDGGPHDRDPDGCPHDSPGRGIHHDDRDDVGGDVQPDHPRAWRHTHFGEGRKHHHEPKVSRPVDGVLADVEPYPVAVGQVGGVAHHHRRVLGGVGLLPYQVCCLYARGDDHDREHGEADHRGGTVSRRGTALRSCT